MEAVKARKKFVVGQVIAIPRAIEIEVGKGKTVA
jgi:hypothetical protein